MKCVAYNNMVRSRKHGNFVKVLSQCSALTDAHKSIRKSVTEIMP